MNTDWFKNDDGKYECKICHKVLVSGSGMGLHVKYHSGYTGTKGYKNWSKGLTKTTNESVAKRSETQRKLIQEGKISFYRKGRKYTEEERLKMQSNPKMGGYREGSGRGKKGYFHQVYFDSTWELAWLMYQIDHGKSPVRCNESFLYDWNGKEHKYYPDFILDGNYIEIKGWVTPQWEAKKAAWDNSVPLIYIGKKEIQVFLDYAQSHYGDEFWVQYLGSAFKQNTDNHKRYFCKCGIEIKKGSKRCYACQPTKIDWPARDWLIEKLTMMSKAQLARELGVSDTAITKHLKQV